MGSKILNFFKRLSVTQKVILCILAFLVTGYIFCLPRHLFHVPYSTVVTDRNEELLGARIASDGQWRFPPRNTTPEKIKECLITFEDKHFYHHWGVNPFAIGRAFYQNVKNKRIVSGGSTLTMQTIRLARNESRTFREKLIEMIWATRLEFRASKEEILSMYISHAPFGGNVVGLDAAAWRYFGHSADDLSWAESAMLAVLPNAPAMIHLSKGRKTLLDKRNRLLKQLLEKKTIDSSTYELAISEPLPDEPHALPQIAPYLVSRFYQERNGEYSRSTINKGIQTQVEDLAERWSNEFGRSDIRNLAFRAIKWWHTAATSISTGNKEEIKWTSFRLREVRAVFSNLSYITQCYKKEVYCRICCCRTYPSISTDLRHRISVCSSKELFPLRKLSRVH